MVATPPRPRRGARLHQRALTLQFACGAYLWLVPDEAWFLASQLVVLVHVVSALLWLPVFAWWLLGHVLRPGPRRLQRITDRGRLRGWLNAAFLGSVVGALASGVWVIARSEGMPAAYVHTVAGALVVCALLAHYLLEARHHLVRSAATLAGVGGALILVRLAAPDAEEQARHAEEATLAPESAYDDAAWCGSCHLAIYEDWKTSAHGRALTDQNIRDELAEEAAERPINLEADLALLEAIAAGDEGARSRTAGARLDPCVHCHAPTSFYGDSQQPILEATDSAADAIPCSFCHTLQGVDASGVEDMSSARLAELAASGAFADVDAINELLASRMPRYVSKPQRVRRYLFQNSADAWKREVGDLLIRWRPHVHRLDYHPAFLGRSEACQACHGSGGHAPELFHQTYPVWARSRYAGSDGQDAVECQDCHMVAELTGDAHRDPGRHVPWGPKRASRRNHQLLGGNLSHIDVGEHQAYVEAQRELRRRALALDIDSVTRPRPDRLEVSVQLHNRAVGHDFPGRETPVRFAWVRVEAQDADGNVLGSTPVFHGSPDVDEIPADVIVYYRRVDRMRIEWDTSVPPDGSRTDAVHIDVPSKAVVARVLAHLHSNTDPHGPALTAELTLPSP